jgi:hypothetical protein
MMIGSLAATMAALGLNERSRTYFTFTDLQ